MALAKCNGSSLQQISLHNIGNATEIGDESGREITQALIGHPNLMSLLLDGNSIGILTCVALGSLLQNPNFRLIELDLYGNNIDDEGAAALGSALANNTILEALNLG
mmetsp:Transcript_20846/g.45189  ORF Transcript_20846/g.45189 Transcript_20846/m.45189 type:complete len:107 (-) Transcript_20846:711-1031(-)|eukprot:CAMPEP_0172323464 /NCGR_PEP_ID=MMETSP1058-20130122/48797_1 /TAXON_ID=83371 /ORGANISM="Detonula confervacea, Strain CCMP 353" /LENGTH=106 /DNA_ID=CAMNT_0013039461 /DNA_START=157 /DNA_END=477 /DNA_ORIENTATION=-